MKSLLARKGFFRFWPLTLEHWPPKNGQFQMLFSLSGLVLQPNLFYVFGRGGSHWVGSLEQLFFLGGVFGVMTLANSANRGFMQKRFLLFFYRHAPLAWTRIFWWACPAMGRHAHFLKPILEQNTINKHFSPLFAELKKLHCVGVQPFYPGLRGAGKF